MRVLRTYSSEHVIKALNHRRVMGGRIAECEQLYDVTQEDVGHINTFLLLWKEDTVLALVSTRG